MRGSGQRLGRRFGLVLGTLVVLLGATAVASAVAVRSHRDVVRERADVDAGAIDAVHEITEGLVDQDVARRAYLTTLDPQVLHDYESGDQREQRALAAVERLAGHVDGLDPQLEQVRAATDAWRDRAEREIAVAGAGDRAVAAALAADPDDAALLRVARAEILETDDLLDEYVESLDGRVERATGLVTQLAFGGVLVGLGLLVLTVFELRRVVSEPLAELAAAVDDMANGHLDREIPASGFGEIGVLARGAETMRVRLLDEIERSVRTSVLDAEQAERERLAGELHDDPVQTVYAAQLRIASAARTTADPETAESLAHVAESLGALQHRLRSLMFRLHPDSLDAEGLPAAVRHLLDESFPGGTIASALDVGPDLVLDEGIASVTFRLIAEAVRNVAKHATAGSVTVRLQSHAGGVLGEVIDDGAGFDPSAPGPTGHHGIEISRSLAEAVGGWWMVVSTPTGGTTVRFWLPS